MADSLSKLEKARELSRKLKKYTELEGSELGEVGSGLLYLSNFIDYVSEDFFDELIKEMEAQLKNYEENTKIIQRTTSRYFYELEWKD